MAQVNENLDSIFGNGDGEEGRGLTGLSLEQIRSLASRLRVGEKFKSFEEFDLAIDCSNFENGRPCHRVKTQKKFRLRICREGGRMITRKETIDYAERVDAIVQGREEENFPTFETFTQGRHVRTGPYDRQNIRVGRNGRCGERLRYLTAGTITRKGGNETTLTHLSRPPATPSVCGWRVKARLTGFENEVVVTVCNLEHSCSTAVSKWRGHAARSKFLAQVMGGKLSVDLNVRVRSLQEEMRITYGEGSKYQPMWRARELCREQMHDSNAESFNLIPGLLETMRRADPECIIDWGTFEGTDIFSRAFISPGASRHMFQYCQKVIALDACHSKNRRFPCQIFLASALDGNKEAVILCYAVAQTEDTDTWTWFCRFMKQAIVGIDKETTVIISDRQKGLANAVDDIFEDILHGSCAHHILMNLHTRFGKQLAANFNNILYAKTPERFERLLNSLEQFGQKGIDMADYLRMAEPWRWARCLFPLPRYGRTTSNLAESLNSALLPIRFGAAYKILHDIWYYMQQAIFSRREKLHHMAGLFTPYAQRRFIQNERYSRSLVCLCANTREASVSANRGSGSFVVKRSDGGKGSCGCCEYQEMVWPCSHGIAFERELGNTSEDRFDHIWLLESLQKLYDDKSVPPLDLTDVTPDYFCTAPPEAVRRGRHRVVRIPNGSNSVGVAEFEYDIADAPLILVQNEQTMVTGDAPDQALPLIDSSHQRATSRIRSRNTTSTVRCGSCKQLGHNRRTCRTSRSDDT